MKTEIKNRIIMGGSQSSGSSLLVNVLNRHSKIISGPETYLFMHPKLYKDWEKNKSYLIKTNKFKGLKSEAWFRMNGAKLLDDYYSWQPDEIKNAINESNSFLEFSDKYMSKALNKKGATVWIEKSPVNTVSFNLFLNQFSNSKVIHVIRNPYDTITSIVKRGYSFYYAVGTYVVTTALALRCREDDNYCEVRYEELVKNPVKTVKELMGFIGLDFEEEVLKPTDNEKDVDIKLGGWINNEKGVIQKSSLNRFDSENEEFKENVKLALSHFRINEGYALKHGIKHRTIKEILSAIKYEYLPPQSNNTFFLFKGKVNDHFYRLSRWYPFLGSDYPGEIV